MASKRKSGGEEKPEVGRAGLFEVLAVTAAVRDVIETTATTRELEEQLNARNFINMKRYARYLLLEHLVSPASVLQVFPGSPEVSEM